MQGSISVGGTESIFGFPSKIRYQVSHTLNSLSFVCVYIEFGEFLQQHMLIFAKAIIINLQLSEITA